MPDGSELQFVARLNDSGVQVGWSYGPVSTDQGENTVLTTTYFDMDFEWSGNLVVLKSGEETLEQTETTIVATATGTTETSSFTDNVSGAVQTNTYNYDNEGNFTGGTEFDGLKTVTFDGTWTVVSQSIAIDGLTEVSDTSIAAGALDTAEGSTNYQSVKVISESLTEVRYINQDGEFVGSATINTEAIGDDTITFTSYFDEFGNWVGDKYTDGL